MDRIKEARLLVKEAGVRMLTSNLVTATWGNISCRVSGEELIAITPSGMDYNELDEEDIVILDMEGNKVCGDRKPSTEVPMHLYIYRSRKDINAIIHTHSTYATALACAHKPIAPIVEELVQVVGGDVRVAKYALPGTNELAANVLAAAKDRNAVLLANHGMIGMAKDMKEAFKICSVVEKGAKITILSNAVGQPVPISFEDVQIMRENYRKSYGQPVDEN
ncbi:MAG: class II aldolase/adducin family protein [Bacillota bacterium]|nr:class II aldolase/adducin family protein [Bacillota bacterium]